MGLFSFKTQAPKQFEYRPRFYNPEKEAFDARMLRIKDEVEAEKHIEKPHHHISIRDAFEKRRKKPAVVSRSKALKIRMFVIILSLVLLIVFFYLFGLLTTYLLKNG
jgi:hypothetical protein